RLGLPLIVEDEVEQELGLVMNTFRHYLLPEIIEHAFYLIKGGEDACSEARRLVSPGQNSPLTDCPRSHHGPDRSCPGRPWPVTGHVRGNGPILVAGSHRSTGQRSSGERLRGLPGSPNRSTVLGFVRTSSLRSD